MSVAIQRFIPKFRINEETGCWDWIADKSRDGYGRFNGEGRLGNAHRFAYDYFIGHIPRGLCIDHLCRNRGCVNPGHLEAVTHAENMKRGDFSKNGAPKGHMKGSDNKNAKLSEDKVREIRRLKSQGVRNCDMARQFGVDDATIRRVVAGFLWSHVT